MSSIVYDGGVVPGDIQRECAGSPVDAPPEQPGQLPDKAQGRLHDGDQRHQNDSYFYRAGKYCLCLTKVTREVCFFGGLQGSLANFVLDIGSGVGESPLFSLVNLETLVTLLIHHSTDGDHCRHVRIIWGHTSSMFKACLLHAYVCFNMSAESFCMTNVT